ncbi:MAG: nucleotide sugar dehydrogenase [Herbinix sp.]|jgi:UDPglucose 6-dehydrogenase|nr:nucleotide sugar dehydrogenase [Herbinix sp.]
MHNVIESTIRKEPKLLMKKKYRFAIAGIGYVGLANAVLIAQKQQVVLVDIIKAKVDMVNDRKSLFDDREIEDYLMNKELKLTATTDAVAAYKDADFVIISTATDYKTKINSFDTSSVESVVELVTKHNPNAFIIIKSTVPVGFTQSIREKFHNNKIFFSPEFLREGRALYDILYPSRIVVGGEWDDIELKEASRKYVEIISEGAVQKDIPIIYTNSSEAEAIKLFSNAYLALRVSFFNELDTFAEVKELNTKKIIEGIGLDSRIGSFYNNPSFGYGGYCLPKDTKQLLSDYVGIPAKIIKTIIQSNSTRKNYIAKRIIKETEYLGIVKDGKSAADKSVVVGIYKLTMKANSDNFRQSCIKDIIKHIQLEGINVVIYEPCYNGNTYMGNPVISNLVKFKEMANLIVANRYADELEDVKDKVYTRDIYSRD